jgi:hypothetical protein
MPEVGIRHSHRRDNLKSYVVSSRLPGVKGGQSARKADNLTADCEWIV